MPRWLAPLGVALGVAAIQLPFFNRWISLMDEGHLLQYADVLRRGGELYRDASLVAFPGAFYLLAGLLQLFEPSIMVARWTVLVEFSLLAALVFALLRRTVAPPFAWLGVGGLLLYRIWAFPHWQMYSYSTTALLLIAAAMLATVAAVERPRPGRLALAGLLAGLAVFCKQDYGGATVIVLNAFVVAAALTAPAPRARGPLAQLLWLDGTAALVGLAMAAYYLHQGLLLEMLRQTVLNHLVGMTVFPYSSLPPLLPLFEQDHLVRSAYGVSVYVPSILFSADWPRFSASAFYRETWLWDLTVKVLFWGPYAYAAASLARVVARRRALRDPSTRPAALREALLAGIAVGLVFTLHKPKDWVHVAVMYWPLIALCVVHVDAAWRARPTTTRVLGAVLALPLLAFVGYSGFLAATLRARNDTPLTAPRAAGVRGGVVDARVVSEAAAYAHEAPPGDVAVLPYFPLINFLAERDAPHRAAYVLWPVADVPGREEQIAAALEATHAPRVIYHFTQWVQFPRMDEYAPVLYAYLVDHYRIDRVFSGGGWGYMIAGLARDDAPTPGTPLLAPDATGGALRIEDADGRQRPAEGARSEWLASQVWPFRPVLALRPRVAPERSVLSVPVSVPADGRLVTAVGANPTHWFKLPPTAVLFEIRVVADGTRRLVFSRRLDPHRLGQDRGWVPVEIPLSEWAGRDVQIELVTQAERKNGAVLAMGGFGWPRITGSSGADASAETPASDATPAAPAPQAAGGAPGASDTDRPDAPGAL